MNTSSLIFTRFICRTGLLCILAALFAAGCRSMDKPASASFASVFIYNQSPEKIRQAADAVFANANYQSIRLSDGTQVYEKEATKGEQIAYAGFVGAHEGERTIVRVRMGIQPQGVNCFLLSCKAFVITSPGDFVNEQTFPLYGWQSGPYQELLNNIRDNLKVAAMQAAQTP
ncbi:MAG: hypothetical protein PHY43_06240 [Verrucomicrobiales bacterium]|nr:hypothetical protein [Verrucomicrobiales bacterium]